MVRGTIERSGVDRCMLGSNLPVDSPCASFEDRFSGFACIVADFSATERRQLFLDNALTATGAVTP